MKRRGQFDGASFGPKTLKAIGEAFDQAWAEIAGNFGNIPAEIEGARLRLAEATLSVAEEDSTDVAALKVGALQAMSLDYRIRPKLRAEPLAREAKRHVEKLGC